MEEKKGSSMNDQWNQAEEILLKVDCGLKTAAIVAEALAEGYASIADGGDALMFLADMLTQLNTGAMSLLAQLRKEG